MRALLMIIFFFAYYLFTGGICCWYFYKYKKKDFEREGWYSYLLGYGGRFRMALSAALAIATANYCMYGRLSEVEY